MYCFGCVGQMVCSTSIPVHESRLHVSSDRGKIKTGGIRINEPLWFYATGLNYWSNFLLRQLVKGFWEKMRRKCITMSHKLRQEAFVPVNHFGFMLGNLTIEAIFSLDNWWKDFGRRRRESVWQCPVLRWDARRCKTIVVFLSFILFWWALQKKGFSQCYVDVTKE